MRQYIQLRERGRNRDAAIQFLRPHLDTLPAATQHEMVRQIGLYERDQPVEAEQGARSGASQIGGAFETSYGGVRSPGVICPRCSELNSPDTMFCIRCGCFLQMNTQAFETMRLLDGNTPALDEYFDPNAVLIITIPRAEQHLTVRPQVLGHELIIGRTDGTKQPDIDLTPMQGAELGVSRRHLSITYHPEHHTLVVNDLKSANGTFINAQRLYPNETRTLRQSDELRLGRLVMRVGFKVG